jgi:uncharacterized protein YndB with AHSA1/START domain
MPQAEVTVSRTVEVDPVRVWNTIAAADGLDKWLPAIAQCTLEGSGVGATRYCTLGNGARLKERIVEVDHVRRVFRYSIDEHPLPARNVVGTVTVREAGASGSQVSWGASFAVEQAHKAELEGMFRQIYDDAISGLEAFLKRS